MSLAVHHQSHYDPYQVFVANKSAPKHAADKLMGVIFSHLSWKDVVKAASVCKEWRRLAILHSYSSHFRRQFVPLNIPDARFDEFSLVYKDANSQSLTFKHVHVRKDMAYVHYQEQLLVAWSMHTKKPLYTWALAKDLVWLEFFKTRAVSFNRDNTLSVHLLDEPSSTRPVRVACPSDLKATHVAIWNDMLFILTPSQIWRVDTRNSTLTSHKLATTTENSLFRHASLKVIGNFLIVRTPNDRKQSATLSTIFTVSAIDLKNEKETLLSSENSSLLAFQHDKRPFVVLDSNIIDVQTMREHGFVTPNTVVNYDANSKSLVTFTEAHQRGEMEKDIHGHWQHYGGGIYMFFNFISLTSKMTNSYLLMGEAGCFAFGSNVEQYGPYALSSGPCDNGATYGYTSSSIWSQTTSMWWSKETKLMARVKKMDRNSDLRQGMFLSCISEGERHVGIKIVNLGASPFILAHRPPSLWQRVRALFP